MVLIARCQRRFAPALIVSEEEANRFDRFALACEKVETGCHHDGHRPVRRGDLAGLMQLAGKTGKAG